MDHEPCAPDSQAKRLRPPCKPSLRGIEERNRMVTENMGLVWRVVHRYYGWRGDLRCLGDVDDAVQVGMLALMRAAELWEEECGPFSTYAYVAIRNRVSHELAVGGIIAVPRLCKSDSVSRWAAVTLAKEMRTLCRGDVRQARQLVQQSSVTRDVERLEEQARAARLVAKHLAGLSEREAQAVRLHHLEGKSLRESGKVMGVSRERVRQLVERALRKLRESMRETGEFRQGE